jgi:signal transduction histidine kinase
VLGISVALVAAGAILVAIFDAHIRQRYVKELDDHLLQLAAAVQIEASGAIAIKHDLSDPAFQHPFSGFYWQVAEDGRVLLRSRSLWDEMLPLSRAALSPGALHQRDTLGPRKQRLLVVERLVFAGADNKRPLTLAIAGESRVIEEARRDFTKIVALSLAVLGALLAAASWIQVGAGLAPLDAVRRQLGRLRRGQAQCLEGTYPDELAGLVGDLNSLIATQAQEVERARANAGKLGHGLKTPLAILATEARALRDKGECASSDAIEHEVDTMNAQVTRALAVARAVGPRKTAGTRTPLGPLLERLVGTMKRLPRGQDLEWSLSTPPTPIDVAVDRRDLEEIFGNLLDNARKWASSRVLIRVRTSNGAVEVVIEDDGPGIPNDSVAEVLAGGVRLDRSVPGTGIGLAIAHDLMALNHARLLLDQSAIGGLRALVRFAPERQIA